MCARAGSWTGRLCHESARTEHEYEVLNSSSHRFGPADRPLAMKPSRPARKRSKVKSELASELEGDKWDMDDWDVSSDDQRVPKGSASSSTQHDVRYISNYAPKTISYFHVRIVF